jgi:esterase/lipase superfamily enzyme
VINFFKVAVLEIFAGIACLLLLTGCQQKVYLMPSPIGLSSDNAFFSLSPDNRDENRLTTLYATNREPNKISSKKDNYTIFPSDDLRVGVVTHQAGNEDDSWDDFYEKSLDRNRTEEVPISLQYTKQVVLIEDTAPVAPVAPDVREFFDQINEAIEKSADNDITVYVHGANSNFYRATAQGAQYFHYTGHNSVVLTFSWPSAENILKYKVDVLHAGKTVPAFARLLTVLALNTSARNINIIAYSAGAQVVAPAFVYLRNTLADLTPEEIRQRYRIGEVYFAAPDIDFKSFAYRFERFADIVERVTISSNMSDSVLLHAQRFTGKARLGRPVAHEIAEEEKNILIESSSRASLDVIDIDGSRHLDAGGSHDFWYSHPWVSNDLLLLMLLHLSPEQRGLERVRNEDGFETWRFPMNYEQAIKEVIDTIKKQHGHDAQ